VAKIEEKNLKGDFFGFFLFLHDIQHCFICRPVRFHRVGGTGIEPRTVATTGVRHWLSNALTTRLDLIHTRLDLFRKKNGRIQLLSFFFRLFPRGPWLAGPPACHPPVRPPPAAATATEPYHAQRGTAQLPLPLASELPAPLLPPFRAADRRLLSHLWHVGVAVCAAGCRSRRRYSQRAADKQRLWRRRRRERSAANFGVVSYAAVFGATAAAAAET
jgi:hypothetical protein